ncbi:MAG: HAD hydrolase family protein [Candidatus Obscuribacterales bacterium]
MQATLSPEKTSALKVSDDVIKRAAKIRLVLMDVDGVMTDGKLFYHPGADGVMYETKGFNSHDGIGLHLAYAAGIATGLISGRTSPGTVERARILNMKYVYQGLLDKEETYEDVLKDAGLQAEQTAFIGDDFTDCRLMMRSGLGVAVANARSEVREVAHYVTTARGGEGAVREVMEVIFQAQGLWPDMLAKYGLESAL